jgi:hypothetical protein
MGVHPYSHHLTPLVGYVYMRSIDVCGSGSLLEHRMTCAPFRLSNLNGSGPSDRKPTTGEVFPSGCQKHRLGEQKTSQRDNDWLCEAIGNEAGRSR